jgi:hypothetical protein
MIRDVGITFSSGRRTPDEQSRLAQIRHEIGDYLTVLITLPGN